MMRKYFYADAARDRRGEMKCSSCGQEITDGDYRHRMHYGVDSDDDRYVTHHRACSAEDPEWTKIDKARSDHDARTAALLIAAKAFRDTWGVDDLDTLIEDLEP